MAPELPEAEYEQLENFEFRNQIPRLSKAVALGALIEKLTSPDVNLSPAPVKHADGSVRYPGLDNHGMGSIFEELVRRFNEENNEEAGEHWTPRDAVRLLFGRLTQTASWGLSALQSLTLGNAFDELSPDEQRSLRNLPARVYYGVNSDEAVALRLLGVPRTAAPALAMGLAVKADEPLHQVRGRLRAADVSEWTKAMGERGVSYHRVWSIMEGESETREPAHTRLGVALGGDGIRAEGVRCV